MVTRPSVEDLQCVIEKMQDERESLKDQIAELCSRLAASEFDRDVLFDRLSNESNLMGEHNAL